MTYPTNIPLNFVYSYDFSRDGGAVSVIPLTAAGNELEAGLVIQKIHAYIETAIVGAAAVVELGNFADANGYFEDIAALGTLGASFESGVVPGALLWDNANDVGLNYTILSTTVVPKLEISVAPLTAGKIKFVITCMKF